MAVDVVGAVVVVDVVAVFAGVEVVLATVFVWAFTEPPRQAVSSASANAGLYMEK